MTVDLFAGEALSMSDVKYMKQRSYSTARSRPSMKERFRRTRE